MCKQHHIYRAAGAAAFSLLTATTAFAATLSPATTNTAAAAQIVDAAPAFDRASPGQSASKNVQLVARKGRRGAKRRSLRRNRGTRNRRFRSRGHKRLRGHYYRRRHRGGHIAAGIAGLIIGGAIASSQRNYGSRWDRCDARYRTFRWSDGTYIPYAGSPRVLCPYLRR